MTISKRLLAAAASCTVLLGNVPCIPASAEERSGTCGENVTWVLYDDGHLTISGTGAMERNETAGSPFSGLRDDISSVTIEEGITEIGSSAFYDCPNITEIVLPDSIRRIGFHAFEKCEALETVKFPAKLETIGGSCFAECKALKDVELPETVEEIGQSAFEECDSLTEFKIPSKVTQIRTGLFNGCDALESITIPPTVIGFGGNAFEGTSWLDGKRAEDPLVIVNNIVVDGKKCAGKVTIPGTAAALSEHTFDGCAGMTDIKLSSNILEIPSFCFAGCTGLTEVTLPVNILSIRENAFIGCDNLERLTVKETYCAFYTADDGSETVPKKTEICGHKGSYAQSFAKNMNQPFVLISEVQDFERGDVNSDGYFSVADVVMFQGWLLGKDWAVLECWEAADFCEDGNLNAFDLCLMRREFFGDKSMDYVEPDVRNEYAEPLRVVQDGVRLYLGPDESYPFVAFLPETTRLGEIGYQKDNDKWIFTEYNGQYGWIRIIGEDGITRTVFYDMVAAKPVIYLYPEQETDVHVELELTEAELSTTYPKYNNGWDVTAYPDGTLLNKADGTHHKYLFWDAVDCHTRFGFSKGFCVAGSDTESFLREKLTYMGLTEQEMNEFIVYWLPLMEHNAYNLISFQGDEYTDTAKLDITPAPDSMLRIFMAYVPLENEVDIEPQELETFGRNGFTVVEWGGCEIK